jgi:deoxyinosine 3'endonuclease (endonuclease V)
MATWPATAHELTQQQHALGEMTPEHWQPPTTVLRIGACFVCFEPVHGAGAAGNRGFAGAAVTHRRRLLAGVSVSGPAAEPYRPTLLALREGPLLEQAVRALEIVPEVLVVNATGRDHPRRAGLALHLGAVLGLPTVGVTTRPLLAPGRLACRPAGCDSPAAGGWRSGGLLGSDSAGGQAGGCPCRLADRRPGRGPGGPGRDPSGSDPRAPAPRPHPGSNPAGTRAERCDTCAGLLFAARRWVALLGRQGSVKVP